jgi:excisionase family DNA binding protein
MSSPFIHRLLGRISHSGDVEQELLGPARPIWDGPGHLGVMDTERLSGLGLEPILTTRELADYLGLNVQAIYDLRADGRGPSGVRVGRELRYRVSDVRRWLDSLHEPEPRLASAGSDL